MSRHCHFALVALLVAGPALSAQEAARVVAAGGVLMARARGDHDWRALKPNAAIDDGTRVVALFDADLRSADGAVEMKLLADVGQRGPLPVLEAAATLHRSSTHALDLTLERGLIILTNRKEQGPAKVQLRVHGEHLEVTLKEPKTRLAVELYGRHAPGEPKLDDPKADEPVVYLFAIALDGEAFLQCNQKGLRLHAPPGPAVLVWDSLFREPEVRTLDALPDNAKPPSAAEKKLLAELNGYARALAGQGVGPALDAAVKSDQPAERRAAVTAMGALDELPRLHAALARSPHPDVRDQAVLVLRHWLGRSPGQTRALYDALTKADYTPPQARTVLHLLYGFDPSAVTPETFDLLIDALKQTSPAVRELARWHLVRLAPAGKDIPYDALAPEAARQRAVEQWRALIPPGQLPRAKAAPKGKG